MERELKGDIDGVDAPHDRSYGIHSGSTTNSRTFLCTTLCFESTTMKKQRKNGNRLADGLPQHRVGWPTPGKGLVLETPKQSLACRKADTSPRHTTDFTVDDGSREVYCSGAILVDGTKQHHRSCKMSFPLPDLWTTGSEGAIFGLKGMLYCSAVREQVPWRWPTISVTC